MDRSNQPDLLFTARLPLLPFYLLLILLG
jgi:hypothetical protein